MRMIFIMLLTIGLSIITRAQTSSPDCHSFHAGNFLYTDSTGDTWEMKRTQKHQTERNKRNGTLIKFKIRWLSDCEYRLTQTWSNDRSRRKWNRANYSYRIISTTENSFSYNCACKDSPSISGTVVRAMN